MKEIKKEEEMVKLTKEQMETIKEVSNFNKDFEKLLEKHGNISPDLIVIETVGRLAYLSMQVAPSEQEVRKVFLEATEEGINKSFEEATR